MAELGGEGGRILWWSLIIQLHTCQSSDKGERGRGRGMGAKMEGGGAKANGGMQQGEEGLNDRERE